MADNDELNQLKQEEFKAWAAVHDDLTPEQLSRLESLFMQNGEIQDINLSYSEMRRRGETQKSDFRDWVENHPELTDEQIAHLHSVYQRNRDVGDLDMAYAEMRQQSNEGASEDGTSRVEATAPENNDTAAGNASPEAENNANAAEPAPMTVEEAVRLANGDLNGLNFAQIEEMYAVLEAANGAENSPEANALNLLRGFSETKADEASAEDFVIDGENAAELDAWLRINDESGERKDEAPRNKALHEKINGFYKTFDEEHKISHINSSSRGMIEENFNSLEEILKNYDPLARDEKGNLADDRFAKIEEFYDEMQIDNSDKNADFVSNVYLKRDMADLAVQEAQTELMSDPEFAKLSADEKREALAKAVLGKMQEGISNIISTEMGRQFQAENQGLKAKLKDESLSPEEKEKLLAEFNAKSEEYKKTLNERLQQQTDYMAEQPVQLTDMQKEYLGKIYARQNKEFNPETTWNELSEQDREILTKGAETLKELALTNDQKSSVRPPVKPAPFKAKAATLSSVLYARTAELKNVNKRLAQKTGFMKMWDKVKEFDRKLAKSHPKMWGFAKNYALSATVGLTTGGAGLALLAAYKSYKTIKVFAKKAKANNMGFFTYLKKNKSEAIAFAGSIASSVASGCFAGADLMAHGLSSAGLVGQLADHTIQNGGNIAEGFTQMAGNIHGNAANISASDVVDKVKNIDKETLWSGFKKAVTNPKTALRAGIAFTTGTAAAMVNLAHGDKKKAKEAFWGGLLGASTGLAAAEAANVLGEQAPAPDNYVDAVTGASPEPMIIYVPDEQHTPPENTTPEPVPEPENKPEEPVTTETEKEQDTTPKPEKKNESSPNIKDNDGNSGVDAAAVRESDRALYEEFLKRRSIGCDDPKLAEQMAQKDLNTFTQYMDKGNEKAATDYARSVYTQTEREEAAVARTLDGDDNRKISIAKAKANSAYNDYHEKQLQLQRMDPNEPDYEKVQKASDKALRKYSDSMVKLSQKEIDAQIDRMEKDGAPQERIDELKRELKVLKRGSKDADLVNDTVNKHVKGMGLMEEDKSFYGAMLHNINLRNMGR